MTGIPGFVGTFFAPSASATVTFAPSETLVVYPRIRIYRVRQRARVWIVPPRIRVYVIPRGKGMEATTTLNKHPDEQIDFTVDYTQEINNRNTTISTQAWSVSDGAISVSSSTISGQTVIARITGGNENKIYYAENKATLSTGEILVVTVKVKVDTDYLN